VKGLGVTVFKDKEVTFFEEMGNENAGKIWLAKFDDIKGLCPNTKDLLDFQEYLREKYILKRFYADNDKISTKENSSYLSNKSCEIKKAQSAVNSSNNSMNNSIIFNDNDFKFDSQSETAKPSKFKKLQSSSEISSLKIDTKNMLFTHKPKETSIPLTTRKSDNNIVVSNLISQPNQTNTCRNINNKTFDFNNCNSSFNTNSTTANNTTVTTNTSNNNTNFPFTHDFTKNVKMMENLNNLYSGYTEQKKVDPLDQLFYQYNFSSGNHMRVNANPNVHLNNYSHQLPIYNNQNLYNNRAHLDRIYGVNIPH